MSAHSARRLCAFVALVVVLVVTAHGVAETSRAFPKGEKKCPNNQGPCFGTGFCEAYWNDQAFECGPGLGQGKSLKQTGSIMYGVCVEEPNEICNEYGTLDCASFTVYQLGGCVNPLCTNVAMIFNKCN